MSTTADTNLVDWRGVARKKLVSSTPSISTSAVRAGSAMSGCPPVHSAEFTACHEQRSSSATDAIDRPSRPTSTVAQNPARRVNPQRGAAIAGCCSVHEPCGHSGVGADDGSVPFERFVEELSDFKFVALDTAIDRVLSVRGIDLVRTEWLKALGEGLHEFRVRHDADEVARMFGGPVPQVVGGPATRARTRRNVDSSVRFQRASAS